MRLLKVREVELINEYLAADEGDTGVVSARTPEEDRAETERRRAARIALEQELANG